MTAASGKPVRLRMAPSPTGHWHMGGVRTALFGWLYARKHSGSFVLRIEDTDLARSKEEFEIEIVEMLRWLGLSWDEGPDWKKESGQWQKLSRGDFGPYRQSERLPIYRRYLEKLMEGERAYYCYCSKEELEAERQALQSQGLPPKYTGHCRNLKNAPPGREPQVIRFKTPEAKIEFEDLIRGKITFDASLFGDMPIARNLDSPLYNFAVVVDDHEMEITHVLRGEEHLSNTPKQILLARALHLREPVYGHLPLILAPDRSKLSKRFAETSIISYREQGYLPAAILNFLALLGWHPAGDKEIFSLSELIQKFDLKRVQKSGAVFNQEKLDWLNSQYIRHLPPDKLTERIKPFIPENGGDVSAEKLRLLAELERDRMKTLRDFADLTHFFFKLPDYDAAILTWRHDPQETTQLVLSELEKILSVLPEEDFISRERVLEALTPLLGKYEKGSILWPLRVALSGMTASPDPLDILKILGKQESLVRLRIARNKFGLGI